MLLILQGNVTFSCSQHQPVACTFLSSSSSSLFLPVALSTTGGFSVQFQFRTWNQDGLLLSAQLDPVPRRLELQIRTGRLLLTVHGSGEKNSQLSVGKDTSNTPYHNIPSRSELIFSVCEFSVVLHNVDNFRKHFPTQRGN